MAAGESPPHQRGRRIEIASLTVSNAPLPQYVRLANAALATSGDFYQYVEIEGQRYSHILDPRTGIGLTGRSQVTVIARDGMTADALATALSVLGPRQGMRLVEAEPRAAAYLMRKAGESLEVVRSPRLARYIERGRNPLARKRGRADSPGMRFSTGQRKE